MTDRERQIKREQEAKVDRERLEAKKREADRQAQYDTSNPGLDLLTNMTLWGMFD